jgi:hypothetical protein
METEHGRIMDKLEVLGEQLAAVYKQISEVNGNVRGHDKWISAQIEICKTHREKTDTLTATTKEVRDSQRDMVASIRTGRVLLAVLWIVGSALALVIGAFLGARVKGG